MIRSPNFGFLDPHFAEFAMRAEKYVFDDPNTSLVKLRQFAERVARDVAARHGIQTSEQNENDFRSTIQKLRDKRLVPHQVRELLDLLRLWGNEANHEGTGDRQGALRGLVTAHEVAQWFHRAYFNAALGYGPFRPPPNPENVDSELKAELESLRTDAAAQLALSQGKVQELEGVRLELEEEAKRYRVELQFITDQRDADRQQFEQHIRDLREKASALTSEELHSFIERSRSSARAIWRNRSPAHYIPIAQIRLISARESRCCRADRILAQSDEDYFVNGYCTECGEGSRVPEPEWRELDIWVDCPKGHGRMVSAKVQMTDSDGRLRNKYGFRCDTCRWRFPLANLLPTEAELDLPES
jgi:hypothetical protein